MIDAPCLPLTPEKLLGRLKSAFYSAPVGLCQIDLAYRYVIVNKRFAEMHNLRIEDIIGRTVKEALPGIADQIMDHLDRSLASQTLLTADLTLEQPALGNAPRQRLLYHRSVQPIRNASGTIVGFSVALIDITEHLHVEAALRESEENFRYTVDLNPHVPWTASPDGTILYVSPRYCDLTGLTPEEARTAGWDKGLHPDDQQGALLAWSKACTTGLPYDHPYRLRHVNGTWRGVRARAFPRLAPTGEVLRWYGTLEDIHERKLLDEALQLKTDRLEEVFRQLGLLVREDHLTGLANRRHFDDALQRETARAQRTGAPLALIMIDVDRFKRFNDTYGHPAGDECLRAVAKALGKVLRRQGDLAARYGGEEFIVLLPDTPEEGATIVAQHALDTVRDLKIVHAESATGTVTISAGLAIFQPVANREANTGTLAAELTKAADLALYAAKSSGRNCLVNAGTLPKVS